MSLYWINSNSLNCTYTSPLAKPFEIRLVSIVWTLITCSEMAPASRLANLARCVEGRKCGVWGGWLCPNPCFRWKIWRKSIHLGVVIFRNCPTHFHLRVSKTIRCVLLMDLRIALNLEPPNAVLSKRYGRLLDVLQAGRGECGGKRFVSKGIVRFAVN